MEYYMTIKFRLKARVGLLQLALYCFDNKITQSITSHPLKFFTRSPVSNNKVNKNAV